MNLTIPNSHSQVATEPPAMVRVVSREDMGWHPPVRPIFRPPPLIAAPPLADVAAFASEVRRDLRLAS
jgi:hypothetical protein